jgi:putative endonuclease
MSSSAKTYFVYILSNLLDTVLYIGVTNDLTRRVLEHKEEKIEGFTKRYHVHKLVYFEEASDIYSALSREKQLKGRTRAKKVALIEKENPEWKDLAQDI